MNRKEIIYRIGDLAEWECRSCAKIQSVPNNQRQAWCNRNCEVGKELLELGNQLQEVRKMKLTKEVYQDEKAQGKTDKVIMKKYGVDHNWLYKRKDEWGLKRNRKVVQKPIKKVEPKIQVDPTQDWELKFNHLKGELKLANERIKLLEEENQRLDDENANLQNRYDELEQKYEFEVKNNVVYLDEEPDIGWEEMKDDLARYKAMHDKLLEYVKVVM